MTAKEKQILLQKLEKMSKEELLKYHAHTLMECLGSQADIMEERGYDESDVKERRKYEKDVNTLHSFIEDYCLSHGCTMEDLYGV